MNVKIEGQVIYLQELVEANATEEYCNWLNNPIVNKYLETKKTTINDLKKYIKKQQADPNSFFVGIFNKISGEHIGNMKLEPINWDKKSAVFGIVIGNENYWGKGIGTMATKMLVDYAFNQMGILEISLAVISENKSAIRVYEKVGFKIIKVKKNFKEHDGKFFDKITMSINKK